jgi:serine/threonine protein kinase
VIGTTIGNYEVQRLIAEGGMGRVYLAVHPGMGRQAAVKVMSSGNATDPEIVSRFITEARAANAIRHPNIVDIYDSGVIEGGPPYIVMEYLVGETLRQVLDRGPVAVDDMLDWGGQMAEALAAAHSHGVIHRDLKPDNLFLVPDTRRPEARQVKVLDFGIAKLQRLTIDQVHRTRTGALLGTPLYMSPEQCLSLRDIDTRSDIYSLGVILYEMATGKRPFDGDGLFVVISKHISEPPVAPTTYRADLPPSIEAVILQALAKDPAQRQESMLDVLTQLASAQGEHTLASVVPATLSQHQPEPACTTRTFGREQILAFLTEIDGMLHEPVVMEMIGGAAALLVHGARSETKDINSLSAFDERILLLAPHTTHKIPLVQAPVPYAPHTYEERRYRPDLPLGNLVLWVPERHDILVMKALRASTHDLQVIEEMHRTQPFHLETIVERYNFEMRRAILALGGHQIFDQRIRLVLEKLFGGKYVRGSGLLTMR